MKTQERLQENRRQAMRGVNTVAGVLAIIILGIYGLFASAVVVWMFLAMFGGG